MEIREDSQEPGICGHLRGRALHASTNVSEILFTRSSISAQFSLHQVPPYISWIICVENPISSKRAKYSICLGWSDQVSPFASCQESELFISSRHRHRFWLSTSNTPKTIQHSEVCATTKHFISYLIRRVTRVFSFRSHNGFVI